MAVIDGFNINGTNYDLRDNSRVSIQQGNENAGKALVVGVDGNVTTGDAGISEAVKVSLLDLVRHVAYIDDQGQTYYDALYAALYSGSGGSPRLEAVYTPGTHVVYTDDALDTLREYLTVKRYESAQDSGTVVTDYTLSGTLVDGTSTVLVCKDELSTMVLVEAVDYYNIYNWSTENGLLVRRAGGASTLNDTLTLLDYISGWPRYSFVTNKGLVTCRNNTGQLTTYYPIPVPKDAISATITIKENAQLFNANFGDYIESTNNYKKVKTVDFTLSGTKIQFDDVGIPNSGHMFMTIATKYDTAGTSYPVLPSGVSLVFE